MLVVDLSQLGVEALVELLEEVEELKLAFLLRLLEVPQVLEAMVLAVEDLGVE